jgi:hypothetical protein
MLRRLMLVLAPPLGASRSGLPCRGGIAVAGGVVRHIRRRHVQCLRDRRRWSPGLHGRRRRRLLGRLQRRPLRLLQPGRLPMLCGARGRADDPAWPRECALRGYRMRSGCSVRSDAATRTSQSLARARTSAGSGESSCRVRCGENGDSGERARGRFGRCNRPGTRVCCAPRIGRPAPQLPVQASIRAKLGASVEGVVGLGWTFMWTVVTRRSCQ